MRFHYVLFPFRCIKNPVFLSLICLFLFAPSLTVFGVAPPDKDELVTLRKDGVLAERIEFGRFLGCYEIHPDLIARKQAQLSALKEGSAFDIKSFPYKTGLPSHGNPKVFALLIDFPDYPHTNDYSVFNTKLFGYGVADDKPYESLREYYRRSSYGVLDIQGHVFPWYRAKNDRVYYHKAGGVNELIKEAINSFNSTHDFSVYDNNGDGVIDFFMVFWSGPDTGWLTLWWAWCDMGGGFFKDDMYTVDGKRLSVFSWQWEGRPVGSTFKPKVVIHETGHGLGLPDYYDYDDAIGPMGGVGGLDMMDANMGDHNAFSKWLLDWVSPTVIGSGSVLNMPYSHLLRPSSTFKDCAVIMPGLQMDDIFSEYFIVQNRSPLDADTNDHFFPTDGLLIWHVDARLNSEGTNFYYNNSFTSHKLLRLMEADGLEQIEQNKSGDKGDFYSANQYFTHESIPDSRNYAGNRTGVCVLDIVPMDVGSFYIANLMVSTYNPVSIGEAVDNALLLWYFGGTASWTGQKFISYYGGDAARSYKISDNQNSYMHTTVTGPGTLSFYWKVSSEPGGDYLQFLIDSVVEDEISGEVDWQPMTYDIPAGSHTLLWNYQKNASASAGFDQGYVDKVNFSISSLADGVDNIILPWTSRGDALWFNQTSTYYYAGDAVQSGSLSKDQVSIIETSVSGPGTLSFYWRDSDISYSGDFYFYIDGVNKGWTYENSWEQETFIIPPGPHVLSWEYSLYSDTTDYGWLDRVQFFPDNLTLGEAVDNTSLSWSTYGSGFWAGQQDSYYYGFDAARSGAVSHNQGSYLETTINGPGTLNFWWRVSSELGHDYLEFYVDSVLKEKISGWLLSSWREKTQLIDAGQHTIRWIYYKDATGTGGLDCGWVDKVSFTGSPSLGEALDNTSFIWNTSGNAQWFGQTQVYLYGGDAARSGTISHNQQSTLSTSITGPGMLSFYWKVSCQWYWDYVAFYVDGEQIESINGEVDWQQVIFPIQPGNHTVTWTYKKDNAFSDHDDCAWLDKVEFAPGQVPTPTPTPTPTPSLSLGEAVDNLLLTWDTAGFGDWMPTFQTYYYDGDAAQSAPITDSKYTRIYTTLEGPGTLRFYWKVSSQEDHDFLRFYIDGVEQESISGEVDWSQRVYAIDTGSYPVMWWYQKDDESASGSDCGWLDRVEFGMGTPTPTPIPTPAAYYTFDSGAEGWQFAGQVSPFDLPLHTASNGVLGLSPGSSSHAFSYWFSPDVTVKNGRLYRARWLVGSTTSNPDYAVQFRLRANQKSAWSGWERNVNSNLSIAPADGNQKIYTLFLDPAVSSLSDDHLVVLSFDILSFDANDDIGSWTFLNQMIVEEVYVTPGSKVLNYDFVSGTDAWVFQGTVGGFDSPASITMFGKIGLNPEGSANAFSYWYSPDVAIQNGKVYRVKWEIESSVDFPDKAVQFRLRHNQRGSWSAWSRNVNSFLSNAPSIDNPKMYNVYLDPLVAGTGDDALLLSFDMLSFDANDDVYSSLYLNSVAMDEVTITP